MEPTTLGEKIKYYRQRANKSQFKLETETGLASGSISRIENDSINPTKETLSKISQVLRLRPSEMAFLLGLHIFSISELVDALNQMSACITDELAIQTAIDILFDLYPHYNGGFILVPDSKNKCLLVETLAKVPKVELLEKTIKVRLPELRILLSHTNICVQCFVKDQVFQSFDMVDYTKDTIPDFLSVALGKVLRFQSGILFPLKYKGEKVGVICYAKRVREVYSPEEIKLLELLNEKFAEMVYRKVSSHPERYNVNE